MPTNFSFPIPRFLAPAILGLLMTGCEKPVKTSQPADPPAELVEITPAAEKLAEPAPEPKASAEVVKVEKAVPEPEPPDEVEPLLDVHIAGNKILITGHLQSEYQHRDMIDILSTNFPDHEVVSELDVGPHVKTAGGWGNRVCQLLVPLFTESENGHFHFEAGVTSIGGTVKSEQAKMSLHRHTGYIMGDLDAKGIENNLKVAK